MGGQKGRDVLLGLAARAGGAGGAFGHDEEYEVRVEMVMVGKGDAVWVGVDRVVTSVHVIIHSWFYCKLEKV